MLEIYSIVLIKLFSLLLPLSHPQEMGNWKYNGGIKKLPTSSERVIYAKKPGSFNIRVLALLAVICFGVNYHRLFYSLSLFIRLLIIVVVYLLKSFLVSTSVVFVFQGEVLVGKLLFKKAKQTEVFMIFY